MAIFDKINQLLDKIVKLIYEASKKHIPKKIQDKYQAIETAHQNRKKAINDKKNQLKIKITNLIPLVTSEVQKAVGKTKELITKIVGYIKHVIEVLKTKRGEELEGKFKNKVKLIFKFLLSQSISTITLIKNQCLKVKNPLVFMICLSTLLGLSIFTIAFYATSDYFGSDDDFASMEVEFDRTPAMNETANPYPSLARSPFYKGDQKLMTVFDIRVPIYIESASAIKNLNLEVTIQASNRYIIKYFSEHDYFLKDTLNEKLEFVTPAFPLTQEGQRLFCDKARDILNDLLKEKKIAGEIVKVYYSVILGD